MEVRLQHEDWNSKHEGELQLSLLQGLQQRQGREQESQQESQRTVAFEQKVRRRSGKSH